jgi:hypothetical protein
VRRRTKLAQELWDRLRQLYPGLLAAYAHRGVSHDRHRLRTVR